MPHQRGSTVKILMGFQDDIATVAAAGFVLPILSCDVKPAQAINVSDVLQSGLNPIQPFRGNIDVGGSIVVPLDSVAMWYWFKAIFSDPVTTGPSPYVHEFKIPSEVPHITIEEQFIDLTVPAYIRYLGCKITSMSLEVGGDGELTANLGVVGADYEIALASFDASPTTVSLSRVANFQAAVTEGGAGLSNGTRVAINMQFPKDTDTYVLGGAGVRGSLPDMKFQLGGTLTTLFESTALLTKAVDGTESGLKVTITRNANSIFELEYQELEYAVTAPGVTGPQGIKQELSWQAFLDDGSETSAVVARLTNTEAHA